MRHRRRPPFEILRPLPKAGIGFFVLVELVNDLSGFLEVIVLVDVGFVMVGILAVFSQEICVNGLALQDFLGDGVHELLFDPVLGIFSASFSQSFVVILPYPVRCRSPSIILWFPVLPQDNLANHRLCYAKARSKFRLCVLTSCI